MTRTAPYRTAIVQRLAFGLEGKAHGSPRGPPLAAERAETPSPVAAPDPSPVPLPEPTPVPEPTPETQHVPAAEPWTQPPDSPGGM